MSFWHKRPVLVTGHTGFKGGWLSLWLQKLGAQVTGFSLAPPTTPALFDVAQIGQGMTHFKGDLRDASRLDEAFRQSAPEVVFHLAAQSLVREGYRDPMQTITSNILGTVHLLEALRRQPSVRAVVIITTDKCYLNREWLWPYREDEPLGGKDPYSASKACCELLSAAWQDSFLVDRVAVATARAGNVIGGGDWATDRLVPDALKAWQSNQPVIVRYPQAVRPWQHVLEPLAGYLLLAQKLCDKQGAGAWNFGPAEADFLSVAELLNRLSHHWGTDAHWQYKAGDHLAEAGLLRIDSSKARHELGWRARFNADKALEKVVDWHRAWCAGQNMRQFSIQQIDDYEPS